MVCDNFNLHLDVIYWEAADVVTKETLTETLSALEEIALPSEVQFMVELPPYCAEVTVSASAN